MSGFKDRRKLNRNIRNCKGYVKIFPVEGNPAMLSRKIIFHDSITRDFRLIGGVVLYVQN